MARFLPLESRPWFAVLLVCLFTTVSLGRTPDCGINAAFAAVSSVNSGRTAIDYKDLLSGEYVGSSSGSSRQELLRAVEALGASAVPFDRRGIATLRGMSWPLILHTRSSTESVDYDHWMLVMGLVGDQATIIDHDGHTRRLSVEKVLMLWDGSGIEVFRKGGSLGAVDSGFLPEVLLLCFFAGLTCLAGPVSRMVASGLLPRNRVLSITATVTVLVSTTGLICYGSGFVRPPSQLLDRMRLSAGEVLIPEVGYTEFNKLIDNDEVSLIDCRFSQDFEYGSIPGAISVPVDASVYTYDSLLSSTPKNDRVVVFCQSKGCGFSDDVAMNLIELGWTRVSIYRGGYREYKNKAMDK